jgi:hypothetical protein
MGSISESVGEDGMNQNDPNESEETTLKNV